MRESPSFRYSANKHTVSTRNAKSIRSDKLSSRTNRWQIKHVPKIHPRSQAPPPALPTDVYPPLSPLCVGTPITLARAKHRQTALCSPVGSLMCQGGQVALRGDFWIDYHKYHNQKGVCNAGRLSCQMSSRGSGCCGVVGVQRKIHSAFTVRRESSSENRISAIVSMLCPGLRSFVPKTVVSSKRYIEGS